MRATLALNGLMSKQRTSFSTRSIILELAGFNYAILFLRRKTTFNDLRWYLHYLDKIT